MTTIEGKKIHFIHQKSRNPSAMPLIMTHGYPGTFWEMLPTIQALADPTPMEARPPTHSTWSCRPFQGSVFGRPLEDITPDRVPELWVALMDKLGYTAIRRVWQRLGREASPSRSASGSPIASSAMHCRGRRHAPTGASNP